jgi:hypothetical protein
VLQLNPHDVPLQVAVAFAGGAAQAVHDEPQVLTLLLLAQLVPQT